MLRASSPPTEAPDVAREGGGVLRAEPEPEKEDTCKLLAAAPEQEHELPPVGGEVGRRYRGVAWTRGRGVDARSHKRRSHSV